jgi:GNAT superfamily N-acetyltransferase
MPELDYKWYGVHPFLGDNWLEAHHEGKTVARLYWKTDKHPRPGEISLVQVHPDYRRRGIASDMVNTVREEIDPNIQFSSSVSPDGKAWSKANGYKPPKGESWQNLKPRNDASEWRESRLATAPVLDKPADFPDDWFEKHWGDDDDEYFPDAPLPVPEQTGPPPRPADKILNEWAEARDSVTPENLSDWHAAPWTNPLEQTLYKEFQHDWWPNSEASKVRTPENVNTGWYHHPDEPITHWLNVEDFLNERYPEAATGGRYGLEKVTPMLQRQVDDRMLSPKKMEEYGYIGHGNAITQAMLNLHNKLQGRKWDSPQDRKRYYELMLRHIGPNGKKVSRLAKLIEAMAWDEWAPQIQNTYGGCGGGQCIQDDNISNNYHVDHGDGERSYVSYFHKESPEGEPNLLIRQIYTNESHRNDGVAEALMRRLADDHPGFKIDPGRMTEYGQAFHDRMLEKEPTARELVTAAHEVMRHANYLESPEGRAHLEQLMQMQQQQEKFRNGPHDNWYHVSPHDLPEGTKLVPGGVGSSATSQDFYDMGFGDDAGNLKDMGAGRTQHVWLTPDLDDAHFWSAALNAPHIYEVDPHETPSPWNGTGTDGFVSPGATIRKKVSGGQ